MDMQNEIRKRVWNIRQKPAKYSVSCDETGLTQTAQRGDSTETVHVAWDDVTNVFAYKRDCFAVDQICIVIGTANHNNRIEVREDDDGYKNLIGQMPIRIQGCPAPDEWWERVALPPFEMQWTKIYTREP
jgi:hypothetical protein